MNSFLASFLPSFLIFVEKSNSNSKQIAVGIRNIFFCYKIEIIFNVEERKKCSFRHKSSQYLQS